MAAAGETVLTVAYGTTTLSARVRRSARRRTVALTIDPSLGLVVTAPTDASEAQVAAMIRAKARWIAGHLRGQAELEAPMPPRQGRVGESLLYLGRHYQVVGETGAAGGAARLRGAALRVLVVGVVGAERGEAITEGVRAWLRARAGQHLPARVALWAPRLGVSPRAVLVREPSRRWGSCSAGGEIRLNWRIIQAPMALVDYVVAHELTHLVHSDHSAGFWARLGEAMPDYERRREELRRLGPQLGW